MKKIKLKRSLRLSILILVLFTGVIISIAMEYGAIKSYENKAVAILTADIQNQCTILSNQLGNSKYLKDQKSDLIDAELLQLANVYSGRVMVINSEYKIIKDSYEIDENRILLSSDIMNGMSGEGNSHYDSENSFIEVVQPIMKNASSQVEGVLLVSISTDSINNIMNNMLFYLRIIRIVALILAIVASTFWIAVIIRPFTRMAEELDHIVFDYKDKEVHEGFYLETQQVATSINELIGRIRLLDNSRDEFVANVSHELKTPMTSMKVLADSLLTMEEVPTELYREFLMDITQEVERENEVINDLLTLVKMDRTSADIRLQTFYLNDMLEGALKRLRPIAEDRNIEVILESFRPVTIEADRGKLIQVISNLVDNAIKYNDPGGWVHVTLNADYKYCYLKVEDSGIGIPKESLDSIFERFYRVDKSHSREVGGTGLGLAIVRSIVLLHHGDIKVYSKEGEGSTFTIRLPLTYVTRESHQGRISRSDDMDETKESV